MTFIWVQEAVDGSLRKLCHVCTQSVQSHKPRKVKKALEMSSNARPSKT